MTDRIIHMKAVDLSLLEDDVVHAHFKNDVLGTVEDVHELFETIGRERNGRKGLLVVTVGDRSTLTNEARALASSSEGDKVLAADAIVLRDFGHQLAANAFVRHNRPLRPTQLFPDMKSAIQWLGEQHHLIENS